jgi:hypothetical protein
MRVHLWMCPVAAIVAVATTARAQVVNIHNAFNAALFTYNYDAAHNYSSQVYTGQGAAPDPGNNGWNGFGGFSRGTWPAAAITSAGAASPVRLSVSYGFDTGGVYNYSDNVGHNLAQGLPAFLLGNAAAVDSTNPGAGTAAAPMGGFVLHNVPADTYTLYLYGADYNNDRGTTFALDPSNGGSPDGGISSTLNDQSPPGVTLAFSEGANYVIFNNVHPDSAGNITATFIPNPADGVGNSNLPGEADFNGLQLIAAPEPAASALALFALVTMARRRRGIHDFS